MAVVWCLWVCPPASTVGLRSASPHRLFSLFLGLNAWNCWNWGTAWMLTTHVPYILHSHTYIHVLEQLGEVPHVGLKERGSRARPKGGSCPLHRLHRALEGYITLSYGSFLEVVGSRDTQGPASNETRPWVSHVVVVHVG